MTSWVRPLGARRVFYTFNAVLAFAGALAYTTYIVYYYQRVGMNPLQLVLVGTVLEGSILLLEVPTGVLADTYSRRLSVILGVLLLGASCVVVGSFPLFGMVLTGQVISAFGYAFMSGASDAWLADEIGEANVGPVYIRSGQIERIAGMAGTILGPVIASLAIQWTFISSGLVLLGLGIFLALAMPETGFIRPAPRLADEVKSLRQSTARLFDTAREGTRVVRAKPILITLILVSLFIGAASEGFDRLGDAHLLSDIGLPAIGALDPVLWFAVIGITGSLIGILVVESFRKRLERLSGNPRRIAVALVLLKTGLVLASLIFALTGSFPLAFVALQARGVIFALSGPLYNTWLVQNIQPRVRATVLSMVNQGNALGQTVFGPVVGAIGNWVSLRAALVAASALLLPEVGLYARVAARGELDKESAPGLAEPLPGLETDAT